MLSKFIILSAKILSPRAAMALSSILGRLAFSFNRKKREIAIENIKNSFSGVDSIVTKAMAAGCFVWFERNVFDAVRLAYIKSDEVLSLCSVNDESNLRVPYERGNGVIALTGQMGNRELLAAWVSLRGYKITVVDWYPGDSCLSEFIERMLCRYGVISLSGDSNTKSIYGILGRGEIVGTIISHNTGGGISVPFFGSLIYAPGEIARISLESGAAIVPLADHMQPNGKHQITILPELEFPPADLPEEERIEKLTASCMKAVESLIRIYPQQWVWFHDHWNMYHEMENDIPLDLFK